MPALEVGILLGQKLLRRICLVDVYKRQVDMYLILRYLMSFDAFVEISGVHRGSFPPNQSTAIPPS